MDTIPSRLDSNSHEVPLVPQSLPVVTVFHPLHPPTPLGPCLWRLSPISSVQKALEVF